MFCYECGSEINPNQKFCTNCGSAIKFSTEENTSEKTFTQRREIKETTKISSADTGLIKAFRLRQNDTGWGRALANLIPFYGIFYAFSRKTITPFGMYMFVSFLSIIASVMMATSSGYDVPNQSQRELRRIIMIIATPFIIKFGINQSREYAKRRLDEIESNSNENIH